jgi:integrase
LQEYLSARNDLDQNAGKPRSSLPVFSRHDRRISDSVFPLSTDAGRAIVQRRVIDAIGKEAVGTITPHTLRHYFVTTILHKTGNIFLAKNLARHSSTSVTERYVHLVDDVLDKGYEDVFNK